MNKIGQSEGFLGRLLGPILKTGLALIENALKPLAKSALIPIGLKAAESVKDEAIHKKMFGSCTTTVIISNEEMNDIIDIMKIIKSLEESSLLIKRISETIKKEAKEQKGRFLIMLLGTLAASLLDNLLSSNNGNNDSDSNEARTRHN